MLLFLFVKKKTAYELRIRYWSSDVCSSDLDRLLHRDGLSAGGRRPVRDPPLRQSERHLPEPGHRRCEPVGQRAQPESIDADHCDVPGNRHSGFRALSVDQCFQRRQRIRHPRSAEHTSELQSLMRISYAVFCLTKKTEEQTPDLQSLMRNQY